MTRIRRRGAYKGLILRGKYLEVYMPSHPNATGTRKLHVPLHRLIMEWVLKRKLTREEIVHHIDGNTLNNHPANLALMSASEHNRLTASNRTRDKYGKLK